MIAAVRADHSAAAASGSIRPVSRLHVAEDRRGAGVHHAQRRGDERVRGHDHLVARPDPGGDERQRERGRARGHPDALRRSQ